MSTLSNLLFALQWVGFKKYGQTKRYEALLKLQPNNLFQLSFWLQLIMVCKIQQLDIPDQAVFYLSDKSYLNVIEGINESDKVKINIKLGLASYIFAIQTNEILIRNIQQTMISGSSLNSLQGEKSDSLRIIKSYLVNKSSFLSPNCLTKIANFLKSRIHPSKQLKHIGDGILGTFIVQQIASRTTHIDQLKKYVSVYKKQKAFNSIKQYMIKNKNPQVINITIQLAEQFGQISEILRIFHQDVEKFYSIFWYIVENNLETLYQSFYFFMLKYASIKIITLHQIAYVIEPPSSVKLSTFKLIQQKSPKLFYKFRKNPFSVALQCVSTYLRLSKFNIQENKLYETFSDPLSLIAVSRKIWQDQFHNKVINYCLWILLDQILVRFRKNNSKSTQSQQNTYIINLSLVMMHISIGYKVGTFVSFYPYQHNLFQDMFILESLPTILLNCPKFNQIPWISFYANSDPARMVLFENGLQFMLKLMSLKINIYDQSYLKIVNLIQHYFSTRNFKFLIRNSDSLMNFFNNLSTLKNFSEVSERLRKALDKLTNYA